jgi:hypothetical protein
MPSNKISTPPRKRSLLIAFLFLVVFGMFAIQFYQTYKFRHQLLFIDGLEHSNRTAVESVSTMESYLDDFAGDLNQIRSFLLLPTQVYDFGSATPETALIEEEELSNLVFEFINELGEYESSREQFETNEAALIDFVSTKDWAAHNLSLSTPEGVYSDTSFEYRFLDLETESVDILNLVLYYNGEFELKEYGGHLVIEDDSSFEVLQTELEVFLSEGLAVLWTNLARVQVERLFVRETILVSEGLQGIMTEHDLLFLEEEELTEMFNTSLMNADAEMLGQIQISKLEEGLEFLILREQEAYDGESTVPLNLDESGVKAMIELLNTGLDVRTILERKVDTYRSDMAELLQDRAFLKSLNNLNLQMGETMEDDIRINYPVLDETGIILRTIYIDKFTGELQVEAPEQNTELLSSAIEELRSYAPGKKKLWISQDSYLSIPIS